MTNAKTTKRALFASVISLLLCATMLIGTTFAWFTDSVTAGKNTIVAGNLDVDLQYSTDGSTWNSVDENTNVFSEDALWEPGYTQVVYLKVINQGNLALKYRFGINVESKVIGKTAEDKDIDLTNYIMFGVVDVASAYANRAAARAAVESSAVPVSSGYSSQEGHLEKSKESGMIAMVVYMPEEVGNEANHGPDEGDVPSINLGVSLVATQDTVESDSFGTDYDENAPLDFVPVSGGSALNTALYNGGTIVLTGDTTAQSWTEDGETYTFINVNAESTIDLNGYSLESEWINVNANVTIENGTLVVGTDTLGADGATVTLKNVTLTSADNADDEIAFWGNNGDESYVLDNVTTSADITAGDVTLTINSGTYSGDVSGANTINGGTFSGDILVTKTTINGGEITGTVTTNGNSWDLVINDGEFAKDSLIDTLSGGAGDITINGGTFSCTSICESASGVSKVWGTLTVTGGTFTEGLTINTTYANVIKISGGNFKSLSLTGGTNSPITISGGTFGSFSAGENVIAKLTVIGGTFGTDPSDYLKDGYMADSNGDGTWTVKRTETE